MSKMSKHIVVWVMGFAMLMWSPCAWAQSTHPDIDELDFDRELTAEMILDICNAVRGNDKGIYTESGMSFWRYEELILELLKVDVSHPDAIEIISRFLKLRYQDIGCREFQTYPKGGLMQQMIYVNHNDGNTLSEFLCLYEIDPATQKDAYGNLILPWLRDQFSIHTYPQSILDQFSEYIDIVSDLIENGCDDDFLE